MDKQGNNIPLVDLVVVIDTSPSMRGKAQALSKAAASAITSAESSCPSDLRTAWFGIEGTWRGTNFSSAVRTYLTKKCKVSEAKLRGRKRRELTSAGAQEDAARAIEDISDYFDWRLGAARAIFYLGDEVLQTGGDETKQKDVEAANLAIQKAQAAKVTVHTHLGSSNSKRQEGVEKEYFRVATLTGGQYFKDRDTVDGFSAILERVICCSRTSDTTKLKAGSVYIQDSISNKLTKLYTLDLTTGKATFIREIATEVSGIAFIGSQLYGLNQVNNKIQLIKIDIDTGNITVIGDIGFAATCLSYDRCTNNLYATTPEQLIDINLETGRGTQVATVASKDYNCGEVAFDADGKAYVFLIGHDKRKLLASCNVGTGKVNIIGDTGFPGLASMEFIGNILYGVTGSFFNLGEDGQLIRIDTGTGKGTLVCLTEPSGRWGGISIYEPVREATTQESQTTIPESTSEADSTTTSQPVQRVPQVINNQKEKAMTLLTIDTKSNCYVIDASQMDHIQQNVANSFSLDQGSYEIKITGGTYKYAKAKTGGEPFVLLWVYGIDGGTFVNQNTGFETGATWTTLNGYHDTLKIAIKEKAVLCSLFFDVDQSDNSGSVQLSITSDKPNFNPTHLTVDSKKNCYLLDESNLSSLRQVGSNAIELDPGDYSVKVREGNASYWSESKKFKLEPWALIWVKGGRFISKLAGVEVEESWCSLNGLRDEVVLEVKEKTTLSGLFFDTYKEDNEGQVILVVEPVSATELKSRHQEQQERSKTEGVGTESTGRDVSDREVQEVVEGSVKTGSVSRESVSTRADFSFRFDEAQMEQMWQQMAAKIESSMTVTDEQDTKKGAYWYQLETSILKGYQTQAKSLAMQVARTEFMTKALTRQMEVSFNQNFQAWSGYFDKRLEDLMSTRIGTVVEELVDLKVADQTQKIKDLVVEQIQTDLEKRIDSVVNLKIADRIQEIKNSVTRQIQTDLEKRIDSVVSLKIVDQTQEISNLVALLMQTDVDQRIDKVLDNKILNFSSNVSSLVRDEISQNFAESIKATVFTDIKKQQFFLDMQSIKSEVENFYARLGQFETQLYLRVDQGDAQLYNWTLEQLVTLQGCLTDRQALVELFESFSTEIKTKLNNAPCVQTNGFTPLAIGSAQPQLSATQPQQLPEGK